MTIPDFAPGQKLVFKPGVEGKKPWRGATFMKYPQVRGEPYGSIAEVVLDGDPYSMCINTSRLSLPDSSELSPPETGDTDMPTMNAKELRRAARDADIEGWEEMSISELRAAVEEAENEPPARPVKAARGRTRPVVIEPEPEEDEDLDEEDEEDEDYYDEDEADEEEPEPAPRARKAAPVKKAPAKKAAPHAVKRPAAKSAGRAVAADDDNPYAPSSNMHAIAAELLKGGKRSGMVTRLKRKITLNPREVSEDWDEDKELDRRVLICAQQMAKKGYTVEKEGRGPDATIKVFKS